MYRARTSGKTMGKIPVCTMFLIALASSSMKMYMYIRDMCPVPTTSQNKKRSKYLFVCTNICTFRSGNLHSYLSMGSGDPF